MLDIVTPILYGVVSGGVKRVVSIDAAQLPGSPIPPPLPAPVLGLITWDLPSLVRYTPTTSLEATVQMSNPSDEARWYVISYYFLDLNGVAVSEGYIEFLFGDISLNAFQLPPIAVAAEPAHFLLSFSSNENDRVFGLRMLLCKMVGDSAIVVQETSRVEVIMATDSTYNRFQQTSLIGSVVGVTLVALTALAGMRMLQE